jgi:hypothetical protein
MSLILAVLQKDFQRRSKLSRNLLKGLIMNKLLATIAMLCFSVAANAAEQGGYALKSPKLFIRWLADQSRH